MPHTRPACLGRLLAILVLSIASLSADLWAQEKITPKVRYEFEGTRITRIEGPRRTPIGCTDPRGTGIVQGISRSPDGTIFVAAVNGIYSLSDEVRHTTPLPRTGDAPPGEPVWIDVDKFGVLWLQTKTAWGCVDPVHLMGRTHGSKLIRASLQDRRELHLEQADGLDRYQPRAKTAPRVSIEHADTSPKDGVLHVQLKAETRGQPLFGWRLDRRHRFRTQDSGRFEIRGLEPGSHTLHFVVYDQDMWRSTAQTLRVRVPYPKTLEKSFAMTLVAGGSLLLLAGSLLWARYRGHGARYRKALWSSALLVAVLLQVVAGLIPHARGWPFVGFSMYSHKYSPGEHIYQARIVGINTRGGTQKVIPAIAGFPSDGYWQALIPLVYGDDAACARFIAAYNKVLPKHKRLQGFVILDRKHRLTQEGPVEVAPVVMRVYPEGLFDGRY